WGNLVNRAVAFAAKNIGEIPAPGELTGTDREILERSRRSFGTVGGGLERSHFKAAITEAMRTVAEANKYMSDQAPWKLREPDPERMLTVMHVVLQLVDDAKTLLTPFLPRSSAKVHAMPGAPAATSGPPPAEALDSDCRLERSEGPVAEVMAAARAACITRAVTIGTDLASSNWAAQCAYGHPDVYAAVAVHPNETVAAASSPAQREEVLAQI